MAKHVTFWKMKVKPGKLDDLKSVMTNAAEEARIKKSGWKMTIIGSRKDSPNETWGMVTWDTSENYYKNAESPDQDKDYQKMRQLMDADPEWFDCDLIEERHA